MVLPEDTWKCRGPGEKEEYIWAYVRAWYLNLHTAVNLLGIPSKLSVANDLKCTTYDHKYMIRT